jgi:shikimate dehydrogenase
MHNAAFRKMHIDWSYLAWPVPPGSLEAAVAGIRILGVHGANVTMPHKETILPLLDELSGDASSVGAVNTIQEVAGRLIGHNTDVDGFREFVSGDAGFAAAGRRALVLGAGGASRAVVCALSEMGIDSIAVSARREEQAESLTALSDSIVTVAWESAAATAADVDLIVNTTPLGTAGDGDPIPEARFTSDQTIIDLVYHPPSTALVERARVAGAGAWGGLGMLVRQAAASFRIWTGQVPPVETMSAAALHAIGAHRLRP